MKIYRIMALSFAAAGCMGRPTPAPIQEPTSPSLASTLDAEAASRGRAIALVGCASCHAIDARGASPFPSATPFREIVRHRSLDDIEDAMAHGLVTNHPAMPPYVFRAAEIDDLRAYLQTLKSDPEGR